MDKFAELLDRIEQANKKIGIKPSAGLGAMAGLTEEQGEQCEAIAQANPNHDASDPSSRWDGVTRNAAHCKICQALADRIGGPRMVTGDTDPGCYHFQCQANPSHRADAYGRWLTLRTKKDGGTW